MSCFASCQPAAWQTELSLVIVGAGDRQDMGPGPHGPWGRALPAVPRAAAVTQRRGQSLAGQDPGL